MFDDGSSKVCELTLVKVEENVIRTSWENLDDLLVILVKEGCLVKQQLRKIKSQEKDTRARMDTFINELFCGQENFSFSKLMEILKFHFPPLYENVRKALIDELSILEIEERVRTNSLPSTKTVLNRTKMTKNYKANNQRQAPARKFPESDRRLMARLINDLIDSTTASLKTKSVLLEEELLGVRYLKNIIYKDATSAYVKLENLLLVGESSRLQASGTPPDLRSDSQSQCSFKSTPSLDEAIDKLNSTLEAFFKVLMELMGSGTTAANYHQHAPSKRRNLKKNLKNISHA